jgi:hypothetical protein
LILAENDLSRFIKEEVKELEDVVEKAKHQKDSIRSDPICIVKRNPEGDV